MQETLTQRDGTAFKSASCYCRGPVDGLPTSAYGGTQTPVTPTPGGLRCSSVLRGHPHTCLCSHTHICTYINLKKSFLKRERERDCLKQGGRQVLTAIQGAKTLMCTQLHTEGGVVNSASSAPCRSMTDASFSNVMAKLMTVDDADMPVL